MPTNVEKKAKAEVQDDSLIDIGTDVSAKPVDVEVSEKETEEKEVEEKEEVPVSPTEGKNEEKAEEAESEEELEGYSKNVQERINKLTRKLRESERREQAATHYAKNVRRESDDLKQRMTQVDEGYLNEFSERVKSQTSSVKS